MSAFSISSFSSWFILILQDPSSFCTGPKISAGRIKSVKNPNNTIGNRTLGLQAYSAVSQPTASANFFWISATLAAQSQGILPSASGHNLTVCMLHCQKFLTKRRGTMLFEFYKRMGEECSEYTQSDPAPSELGFQCKH